MTNPLSYIPVEILTVIANQLLLKDHGQCCHVNRQWYSFFRRYLYQSIHFTTYKQWNTFLQLVPDQQDKVINPGQWIREIYWHDGLFSSDQQQYLLKQCPHLNTLHLELIDDHIQRQKQPFSSLSSLSHVSLCYQPLKNNNTLLMTEIANNTNVDDYSDVDYYDEYYDQNVYSYYQHSAPLHQSSSLLACLPSTLRSLTLDKIFRALRIDHLKNIHQACPTLMNLTLSVEFLCHLPQQQQQQTNVYDLLSFQQYQQQQEHMNFSTFHQNYNGTSYYYNDNEKKRGLLQQLTIQTAQHYGYDTIMTSGWIHYLLTTYPHLDRLKLGYHHVYSTESPKNNNHVFSDDDDDDAIVVLTKHGLLLNHLTSIQNALVCFISQLRSKILSQHYNTSGIKMPHDQQQQSKKTVHLSEIQEALANAPIDLFNIYLKFEKRQIIELNLHGHTPHHHPFPHRLNLNRLLTELPFLRRFHAESISLECGAPTSEQYHPLRDMKLKKSWICDSALDAITKQCPRFNQLALLDCNVLLLLHKTFRLHMPHHVMQSIVFEGVSLTDYLGAFDDPLGLVQLLTMNELPRFFMAHHHPKQHSSLLLEKKMDYYYPSIIQCHSLEQFIVK
ncbi:hypothetical protein BDA99DRAFT_215763 [Phascolomyces articulosus]|uniref:F-box domain-containing protein n=1 Tax=Phascolomyces articulosus TaxID=60185 RepID=A0AAD5P9C6_9FUNG|nr:hypothetical protein BDA99DRAFT_215763 [Phascolomyces articulosus]